MIRESSDTSAEQRLDLPGLLTSAIGLFALTYALIEANKYGWTSPRILALFAVAAIGLTAFVLLELHQRVPMLDISLFRNATFAGANTIMLLIALAMFGVFFYVSLYVQNVLHYSPTQAGATFLPMTLCIVFLAPVAGKLSDRFGPRWLIASGMALVAGSLVIFAQLDQSSTFWDIFPGLLVGGAGMAMSMAPTTATAMRAVPVDKAGVGSAVLNSVRQVGGSLGIAIMGAIVASYVHVQPPARSGRRPVRPGLSALADRRSWDRLRRGAHRGGDPAQARGGRGAGATLGARGLTEARIRLTATERRAAVVETACRVFAKSSYRGSTTAEIARATGVTEPVLYRHFASKRELYLACLSAAWDDLRLLWSKALEDEEDPGMWVATLGQTYLQARAADRVILIDLWIQALSEAADDPEIRRGLREQVREVHAFVADVMRRSQEAGGVLPDRDVDAEAWIFISLGLLSTIDRRLSGLVGDEFDRIIASRRAWMTGKSA